MCCTFAHLESHPLEACFIDHSLMCLAHSFSSTTSDYADLTAMTRSRRSLCATPHGGFQFDRLAGHNPGRQKNWGALWTPASLLHDEAIHAVEWSGFTMTRHGPCRQRSMEVWRLQPYSGASVLQFFFAVRSEIWSLKHFLPLHIVGSFCFCFYTMSTFSWDSLSRSLSTGFVC